jgi:outer membrane protein OmpA-like peptidoglycan-associated protein
MLLALLLATTPLAAQSRSDREKMAAQTQLAAAEAAVASAEAAGASTSSTSYYNDAIARLTEARTNWNSNNARLREEAGRRAIEARHAAAAAEAEALLLTANAEIRNLRNDINRFGGSAPAVELYEPPTTVSRGATPGDNINIAETAIRTARSAGGEGFAAQELERLENALDTARTLAKNSRQADAANHIAYITAMRAREIEFTARHNVVSPRLPDLRGERTRLAQREADTRALEEQQRRLAAEREAEALRQQLAAQAANRQAEQAEIERLRQQVAQTETQFRARLEEDRTARLAAETALDDLIRRYEAALASTNSSEVEALRRQVEDQSLALRSLQERERLSETSLTNQIGSLEQSLQRERAEGRLTADVLAQREEELRRQRTELQQLQTQREEAERNRATAIAEAERRRAAAETEAARLREQVAQTSAELSDARQELTRRDAVTTQRMTAMQQELSKLAQTRTSERGFIVTLPGLFFDSGKSALKPGARNTLAKIADQLRTSTDAAISIEGHTDSVGSDELNQALSEKRAAAVRDYLVSRGVTAARVEITGRGESAPVASNDTAAGRQQNRRVELVIQQQQ